MTASLLYIRLRQLKREIDGLSLYIIPIVAIAAYIAYVAFMLFTLLLPYRCYVCPYIFLEKIKVLYINI
jgi:hypothetical protein